MADLTTLNSRLADAESALHQLQIGTLEVQIEHGDMRVTYTKQNAGMLRGYIDDLRAQIMALGGAVDQKPRRAMTVYL